VEANKKEDAPSEPAAPKAGWRIKVGFAIFIASVTWPILIPILPMIGLSTQSIAAFTGVMAVVAEVLMLRPRPSPEKTGFPTSSSAFSVSSNPTARRRWSAQPATKPAWS